MEGWVTLHEELVGVLEVVGQAILDLELLREDSPGHLILTFEVGFWLIREGHLMSFIELHLNVISERIGGSIFIILVHLGYLILSIEVELLDNYLKLLDIIIEISFGLNYNNFDYYNLH